MPRRILDQALDLLVVPGFTKLGYATRRRLGDWQPPRLEGRTAMVTGASSGIGEAACVGLARAGAAVEMVVRDRERGEAARERVAAASGSEALRVRICDVSSLASVRELAASYVADGDPLHVLVHNAGVLPPERRHTDEGFELTFATNVLGPFLLTALLLGTMRRSAPARVIAVSSGGMYTAGLDLDDLQLEGHEFSGARFYAHTKRAEVALAEEWARRTPGQGVAFASMHPGWVGTPGVSASLPGFEKLMRPLLREPEAGADTIVWLAGAEEPLERDGEFWHDRTRRPKRRLPGTRESAADRVRLFDACERLAGLPPGGATATAPLTPATPEEE